MSDPKISAKGLAEFAFASPTRRRSIARNYKFPSQGEGIGRTLYYSPALNAIRAYHRSGNDKGILADAIQRLEVKVREYEGRRKDKLKKVKAENNIRAIQIYARQFGGKEFKLVPNPRLKLTQGQVTVTATPDLRVQHRGREFLIKLDLGKKKPKPEMVAMLLYILYSAALQNKLPVDHHDVLYLDTVNEMEHECPKPSKPSQKALETNCKAYGHLWSTL